MANKLQIVITIEDSTELIGNHDILIDLYNSLYDENLQAIYMIPVASSPDNGEFLIATGGEDATEDNNSTAVNLANSIELAYSALIGLTASVAANVVTIYLSEYGWEIAGEINEGIVGVISYSQIEGTIAFRLREIYVFSAGKNQDQNRDVMFGIGRTEAVSDNFPYYIKNELGEVIATWTINNSFPLFYLRQNNNETLTVEDSDSPPFSLRFNLPTVEQLVVDSVQKNIVNELIDIEINTTKLSGDYSIEESYSLGGLEWQSSNVFYNVLNGTYTYYIEDNYGAFFSGEVVVTENETPLEHFVIEEIPEVDNSTFITIYKEVVSCSQVDQEVVFDVSASQQEKIILIPK